MIKKTSQSIQVMSTTSFLPENPQGHETSTREHGGLPARAGSPLTQREQEVIQVLALGCNYREIGAALDISPNTVRAHLHSIYQKLDVNSRARAVIKFHGQIRQQAQPAVT